MVGGRTAHGGRVDQSDVRGRKDRRLGRDDGQNHRGRGIAIQRRDLRANGTGDNRPTAALHPGVHLHPLQARIVLNSRHGGIERGNLVLEIRIVWNVDGKRRRKDLGVSVIRIRTAKRLNIAPGIIARLYLKLYLQRAAQVVVQDLFFRQSPVKDRNFVDGAGKELRTALSPTNPQLIIAGEHIPYGACDDTRVNRGAVDVRRHNSGTGDADVIDYGHMRPVIQRDSFLRINPTPTRVSIGKGPPNRSRSRGNCNLILPFFVDDDAPTRTGRVDPGLDGDLIVHL